MELYNLAKQEFEKYLDNFDREHEKNTLKIEHTYKVVALMADLSTRIFKDDKEKQELAMIIGLLHDLGRFYQLQQTDTFDDAKLDHANYAVDYLFKENHIRDFIKVNKYDSIIQDAIYYHNKYEIDTKIKGDNLVFSKMIRDMDKVDIYRVAALKYNYSFDTNITEEVLEDFRDKKPILKKYIKTESDKILLMLAFVFDINFNESFDILNETDNLNLLLSMIDVKSDSEKLWNKVKEIVYEKIEEGI